MALNFTPGEYVGGIALPDFTALAREWDSIITRYNPTANRDVLFEKKLKFYEKEITVQIETRSLYIKRINGVTLEGDQLNHLQDVTLNNMSSITGLISKTEAFDRSDYTLIFILVSEAARFNIIRAAIKYLFRNPERSLTDDWFNFYHIYHNWLHCLEHRGGAENRVLTNADLQNYAALEGQEVYRQRLHKCREITRT